MKKKLAARLYDAVFPPKPKTSKRYRRDYAAARVDRTNADWTVRPMTANYDLRRDLRILRARARDAAHNNSHFKKYLSMVRSNVIGPKGIRLQCRAYMPDGKTLNADLNKQIETAFWEWGHKENCTVSQRLDWLGMQRLIVTQLARDGEFLVQKIAANNAFGFALKAINVDYLDEFYNAELPNGNRVIMSVEIDAFDRPVAYYLTTPSPDYLFADRKRLMRVRVDASEMIHGFLVFDDESQVRGVTMFHAAMLDAKNLAGYKEGVITSARMAANNIGFLEKNDNDEVTFDGDTDGDNDLDDTPVINVSPLAMNILPDGMSFKEFDPKQPTQNHPAFYKSILMDNAAGLDVPYFDLTGDMEAVNYSSARVGLSESRDIWMALQDFVSTMFCREVYHAWTIAAMLNGALKITAKDFREIQNPTWRARGWQYINPKDEVEASTTALQNNLATLTGELAEQGVDIIDHFETIQQERELAKKYGI